MTILTADIRGRITLGAKFAGKRLRVEVIEESDIGAEVMAMIPAREAWLWRNPEALEAVQEGLAQAARRDLVDGPDLDADASLAAELE